MVHRHGRSSKEVLFVGIEMGFRRHTLMVLFCSAACNLSTPVWQDIELFVLWTCVPQLCSFEVDIYYHEAILMKMWQKLHWRDRQTSSPAAV
jgi:hypothetical protein